MSHGARTWRANGQVQTDSTTMQGGMLFLGTVQPPTGNNQSVTTQYPSWAGRTIRAMLFSQYRFYYTISITYPSGIPTITATSTRAGNTPAIIYVFGK